MIGHFQHQLIMDLHHHPRTQLVSIKPVLHSDHRHLDQVSGCTLHGRIDRSSFSALATRAVG
jgi:hypothetical protein